MAVSSARGSGHRTRSYSYEHEVNEDGYVYADLLVQLVHCWLENIGKGDFTSKLTMMSSWPTISELIV
jgi:hypothetical protein